MDSIANFYRVQERDDTVSSIQRIFKGTYPLSFLVALLKSVEGLAVGWWD